MNIFSTVILLSLVTVILFSRRRFAALGMAAGVLFLTQDASIDVLGFNFFPMRFFEIACFVRVVARREFNFSDLNNIDRLFLLLYCYTTLVFLLRSSEGSAYQIGVAVDAMLCYLSFRALIRDIDDFRWLLRALAVTLVPYVALLLVEMLTGRNPFSIVGAAPLADWFRAGKVRCIGSFRHPSLLGTLGGCFLPIYIGLAMSKRDRTWGLFGSVLCVAITVLSNSGGPIAEVAISLGCWCLWPMRTKMRVVRRALVGLLILLALSMNATVWYLPARVSELLGVGGDSWHRSQLMEMAAAHFGKWWAWGMPVRETTSWFPYNLPADFGGSDITNQFLVFGLAGGVLSIALFILLLVKCYKSLGKALKVVRSFPVKQTDTEFLLWGLGAMLAVHIENWFAISYFDQFYVIWFLQLAAVVSVSQMYPKAQLARVPELVSA